MSVKSVDAAFRRENNKQLQQLLTLKQKYESSNEILKASQQAIDKEKIKLSEINHNLELARSALSEVQAEIDADYLPEGAQPRKRIQNRDNLALLVEQEEATLTMQRNLTRKATDAHTAAEHDYFLADRNLSAYAKELPDILEAKTLIEKINLDKKENTKRLEREALARKQQQQEAAAQAIKTKEDLAATYQAEQAEVARIQQAIAKKKLAEQRQEINHLTSTIKETADEHQAKRQAAALSLKHNLDTVRAEVAGQAQRYVNKINSQKASLLAQKDALLAAGKNPYVEFRKELLAKEAEQREKKLTQAVVENKEQLAQQMAKEQRFLDKQIAKKREQEAYTKEHRESLGRHVIEERNAHYITSRHQDGLEVLDITGKNARIEPSQITVIADHSMGLGLSLDHRGKIGKGSMINIIEKERAALKVEQRELGSYNRLIHELDRDTKGLSATIHEEMDHVVDDDDDDDEADAPKAASKVATATKDDKSAAEVANDQMMSLNDRELSKLETMNAHPLGAIPGIVPVTVDKSTVAVQRALLEKTSEFEGQEEKGKAGTGAASASFSDSTVGKYPLSALSKFERDALERAKERHHDRIAAGVEQVAGGRTFPSTAAAFVSIPAIISFIDFSVGETYQQTITITNVSYTFNSFKLMPLADDILDFFTIKYDPPGRLSAGLACNLQITFSPQVNKDILAKVTLWTETGPVNIPLKCLIKRCAPRLLTREVDLGTVVVGQRSLLTIKMNNSQAIGTRFTVIEEEEEADEEDGQQELAVEVNDNDGNDANAAADTAVGADVKASKPSSPRVVIPSEVAVSDELDPDHTSAGSAAATSETDLSLRIHHILTKVIDRKRREQATPIVCYCKANVDPATKKETLIKDGILGGYSSASLSLRAAPLSIGYIERSFRILYENVDESQGSIDDEGEIVYREQRLTVRMEVCDVPIYCAESEVNLQATLYDRIYRSSFTIFNRGSTAYKVSVILPKEYANVLEVSPSMCFVQPHGNKQVLHIKYSPAVQTMLLDESATADAAAALTHYHYPMTANGCYPNAGLFLFPIEVSVSGDKQDLPVFTVLRTITSSSQLAFSSYALDFGRVYVGQSSSLELTCTNLSMLPQKIAFVHLRKELSVAPWDGFYTLLPRETVSFTVSFAPLSVIDYTTHLTLLTSNNDSYTIAVRCQGVASPLTLSAAVCQLRSTAPGQKVLSSITVSNPSHHQTMAMEVALPDKLISWLKISPQVLLLKPQQAAILELEFSPPTDVYEVDPRQWMDDLLSTSMNNTERPLFDSWEVDNATFTAHSATDDPANQADQGEEAAAASNSGSSSNTCTVGNWMVGNNKYGCLRWTLPTVQSNNSQMLANDQQQQQDQQAAPEQEANSDILKLPSEEWGIWGNWQIPVFIRQQHGNGAATAATTTAPNVKMVASLRSSSSSQQQQQQEYMPVFLTVHTMVARPQFIADTDSLDFGQVAVTSRILKSFRITNCSSSQSITLRAVGLNTLGPYRILRPLDKRPIQPLDSRIVVIECCPSNPGLITEQLEILPLDPTAVAGGHRLYINLRVEGLLPTISLDSLLPPPCHWNARSGLLDFGQVLISETPSIRKFTVRNLSAFVVEATVVRVACDQGGASSSSSRGLTMELTATGLPVISMRPERLIIPAGGSEEIEVIFRPDRSQRAALPYREEFDIKVGATDEILRVGVFGRAFTRQYTVMVENSADEVFLNPWMQATSTSGGSMSIGNLASDSLTMKFQVEERKALVLSNDAATSAGAAASVSLQYLNAFDDNVDPLAYKEVDASQPAAATSKAAGKAPAAAAPSVPSAGAGLRRVQVKRLKLVCAKAANAAMLDVKPASFEVILDAAAKESGLWSVSSEKGSLTTAKDEVLDVALSQPKPRQLGGVAVGSWKTFQATIAIKGGWFPPGETEENKIVVQMVSFVSI